MPSIILRSVGGGFVPLDAGAAFVDDEGNQTSYASVQLWSPQMLASRGLYRREVDPLPDGKIADGIEWVPDDNGRPVQSWINLRDRAPRPVTAADVDAERDRRVDAGFLFGGVEFQSRPADRENIAGAAQLAFMAIVNGAQPGDLRWHGGDADFVWIASDNSLVPMDAPTVVEFAKTAAAHKQRKIFAARALKNLDPIPADYADDACWP